MSDYTLGRDGPGGPQSGNEEKKRAGGAGLRILILSPEALPFVKTGGLGDVAGALPRALQRQGAEVRMVMPFYRPVKEKALVRSIPMSAIFNGMAVRLNPELSADTNQVVGFHFPDTGEAYTVHIRRVVAEVRPEFPENPEITITVDSLIWKEIAAKQRNPAAALVKGDINIKGGAFDILKFIRLFRNNP